MSKENVLGLIAGGGRLPFLIADGARDAGLQVICVGLIDDAEPELAGHVDVFFNGAIARPGGWMRKLRKHGVTKTVMAGHVVKKRIYTPWRIIRYVPDWRALKIWYWRLRGKDKRNDTVLCAIAEELASGQIYLENTTMYCKEHLASEGVMTKCKPGATISGDIEFGWSIAKKLGELDIGQSIAVREKEVIAVEAIEGTAEMIERAGKLCKKGGWTLIKVAKPNQDMRFDVPCVGPETIRSMKEHGGSSLVVEKGKCIIIDKPETIALSNELGISILGY
jgi:DUF1009 family protein